jgi:hypothetical protein
MVSGDQTEAQFDKAHTVAPGPWQHARGHCRCGLLRRFGAGRDGTTLLVDGGQHLLPLSRDVMFVAK